MIYGVSSRYSFGQWEHIVFHFNDMNSAQKWLHTECHNFCERELMNRANAIKLAGFEAVKYALEYDEYNFKKRRLNAAFSLCLSMMLIQKHISTHIMSRVIMTYQQSLALSMYLL